MEILNTCNQFVHLRVTKRDEKRSFFFTSMYASLQIKEREVLRAFHEDIACDSNEAWVVGGDFNAYTSQIEKRGLLLWGI